MINELHGIIGKPIVFAFLNQSIPQRYKQINKFWYRQWCFKLMGFSFYFNNDMLFFIFVDCSLVIKSFVDFHNWSFKIWWNNKLVLIGVGSFPSVKENICRFTTLILLCQFWNVYRSCYIVIDFKPSIVQILVFCLLYNRFLCLRFLWFFISLFVSFVFTNFCLLLPRFLQALVPIWFMKDISNIRKVMPTVSRPPVNQHSI